MNKIRQFKDNLRDWLELFAERRRARLVLFLHSFIDSSIIPLTVDISFVPIAVSRPKRAFQFAIWTALGSVLGSIVAYYIGMELMHVIGYNLIELFNLQNEWLQLSDSFKNEMAEITLAIAAVTPISFTLAGFAAGAVEMNLRSFILISLIFRTFRFIVLAVLIYYFGERVKNFIDKYYEKIARIFVITIISIIIILIFVF